MTALCLLPPNATAFETALSLTTDPIPRLGSAIAAIVGAKYRAPHAPALLAWLIAEYGLSEISQFFVDDEAQLLEGVAWSRVRGTPAALARGLSWTGYGASLDEAPVRWARWNLFELALDRLRDQETPDLARIEAIANLSAPVRSRFFRGCHGWDVRAAETGWAQLSHTQIASPSGVHVGESEALWSFGRVHDGEHIMTQADLEAAGVWIAPSDTAFSWEQANFSWTDAAFSWGQVIAAVRASVMAARLAALSCWVEFRDQAGSVTGLARARACHLVLPDPAGTYNVAGQHYAVAQPGATQIYVEALTGFGEGAGSHAVECALRMGAAPVDADHPGVRWLDAADCIRPLAAVATRAVSILFGTTVRESVRTLLRFT